MKLIISQFAHSLKGHQARIQILAAGCFTCPQCRNKFLLAPLG